MSRTYKIGLSISKSSSFTLDEKCFEEIKAGGLNLVEISEAGMQSYDDYKPAEIMKAAQKSNVQLWSFHLPFAPFSTLDMSSPDKSIRNYTLAVFSEMVKAWSDIGIDMFVVHPSIEPIGDDIRAERLKNAADSLCRLADLADTCGAVIAAEDLPRTCCGRDSAEINALIAGNDKLRVCFDTNHLLKENIVDFIQNVGNKIVTMHVSDYDFVNERHWLPGEGDMEWLAVLDALEAVKYSGPWLYEVGPKASTTIDRRDLTIKDYYDNARTLFDGRIPAPVGIRKEISE